MEVIKLNVYGDNILECERALSYLETGIRRQENEILKKELLDGFIITPRYNIKGKENEYVITLYPGVNRGRWNRDIYDILFTDNGIKLTETCDVILTSFENNKEKPILAIEFSSALPAGNNSWQRSGRALSFSRLGIPYIYAVEIGAHELDKNGGIKSTRSQSSLLILSYLLNNSRSKRFNSLSYSTSPVAYPDFINEYREIINENYLFDYIYFVVTNNTTEIEKCEVKLLLTELKVYNKAAHEKENIFKTLKVDENHLEFINSIELDYLLEGVTKAGISWNKKIKKDTELTEDFEHLRKLAKQYCFSPYAKSSVPIGILPKNQFDNFIIDIESQCPNYYKIFNEAITNSKNDLVIVMINGFKPGGEDSRPDRDLLPFSRMIFGEEITIFTIIYSPNVPEYIINSISNGEFNVLRRNGLFNAILDGSDYTLVDSFKHDKCFEIPSQHSNTPNEILNIAIPEINRKPERIGENDIDTVIHMIFKDIKYVFESFTNPPGGDWSGISIIDNQYEYRWTSLNREPKNVKRPDHIFQIKSDELLVIESKERYSTLINKEKNVGPKMIAFLSDLLFDRPINAKKKHGEKEYSGTDEKINTSYFNFLSAVAFYVKNDSEISKESCSKLATNCDVDLVFGIKVTENKNIVIYYYVRNQSNFKKWNLITDAISLFKNYNEISFKQVI